MTEFVFMIDEAEDIAEGCGLPYLIEASSLDEAVQIGYDLYLKTFSDTKREALDYLVCPTVITTSMIASCKVELENNGFLVSDDFVLGIIRSSTDLRKYLLCWYQDSSGKGLDTGERDYLHDAFAEMIGADEWPAYMHTGTQIESDFISKVMAAAKDGKFGLAPDSFWSRQAS